MQVIDDEDTIQPSEQHGCKMNMKMANLCKEAMQTSWRTPACPRGVARQKKSQLPGPQLDAIQVDLDKLRVAFESI